MQPPKAHGEAWKALAATIGEAYHTHVLPQFERLPCDSEAFFKSLLPKTDDLKQRGEIVVAHEVRRWLMIELGLPATKIQAASKMAELIPAKGRKAIVRQMQADLDWQFPRLGMPVWAQWVAGAVLLFGFVAQFIWPLLGLGLFFGGTFLTFQIEKWASSFVYRDFSAWVQATVERSRPSLEIGQADDDRLRIVFAEMMEWDLDVTVDPRLPFPVVEPIEQMENKTGYE